MQHHNKLVFGFIGMLIAGPPGLVIGLLIGHRFDKKRMRRRIAARFAATPDGVAAAVVVLAAKVAKADGRACEDEVAALRRMLDLPPDDVPRVAEMWREARETSAGYSPYAEHLVRIYGDDRGSLRRILAVLYRVAEADGHVSSSEQWILDDLARIFQVSAPAYPAEPIVGGASATGIERAHRFMFDARTMEQPHLGLKGSGDGLLARLEEKIRAIAARPWGRPALAAAAGGLGWFFVGEVLDVEALLGFGEIIVPATAAAAAAGGTLYALPKPRSPLDELAAMARAAKVDPDLVVATIQETDAKLSAIDRAAAPLEPDIHGRVEAICGQAKAILDCLRRDPREVGRSRPFLDHYLTATLDIVQRFGALRSRQGGGERVEAVRGKLEGLLTDIESVFRKHLDSSVADDTRQLEISIDSLQRMIRSEGA